MKLNSDLTINGKLHRAGETVAWTAIYPFFLIHMLAFGGSGFFMAYHDTAPSVGFLYLHGGFAIVIYLMFYLSIFGREDVKWMLINAGLGIFGIYGEMDWLLSFFGRTVSSYPLYVHVIPFLYYILYTFLLRQAVLDFTGTREDPERRQVVERCYIALSLVIYACFYLL